MEVHTKLEVANVIEVTYLYLDKILITSARTGLRMIDFVDVCHEKGYWQQTSPSVSRFN